MSKQSLRFWLIALAGILLFAGFLQGARIPARLATAEQANLANAGLDALRDPMLSIEQDELAMEAGIIKQEDVANLETGASRIMELVGEFQLLSDYNSALSAQATAFAHAAGDWFQAERIIWKMRESGAAVSVEAKLFQAQQQIEGTQNYFIALRILTEAEPIVHADLNDGQTASRQLWIAGAVLVLYLFLLIVLFQRYRQNELQASYRALDKAHEHIAEREEYLSRTLDSIGDGVIATDEKGRVTRLNPVAEVLTGWRDDEATGRPLEEIFHIINAVTRDPADNPVERVLITGKVVGLANHTVLVSRSGSEFQIADSGAPIKDRSGQVQGVILVFRDVSDEYRLQAEVRKHRDHLEELVAERTEALESANVALKLSNRELESFSYSVSHDLRAPLRSIDGFATALLEDYSDAVDSTGQSYLNRVCSAARSMNGLIDDMLRLSQVTRSEMKLDEVDLSELAQKIIPELREREPERSATIEIEAGMRVHGDPKLLNILLENLLGNAWKYTAREAQTNIVFDWQEGAHEPVYYIRDNGVGFDMQHADKLFRVFQRLHNSDFKGSGVGLSTVERIVQRHGGSIWADSSPENGATFFFTLGQEKKIRLRSV